MLATSIKVCSGKTQTALQVCTVYSQIIHSQKTVAENLLTQRMKHLGACKLLMTRKQKIVCCDESPFESFSIAHFYIIVLATSSYDISLFLFLFLSFFPPFLLFTSYSFSISCYMFLACSQDVRAQTYMQLRQARSRCTNPRLARYAIPCAMSMQNFSSWSASS